MKFLSKLLGKDDKKKSLDVPKISDIDLITYEREIGKPFVADRNFLNLALTIPEVFFPIDYIASRIAKAHFEVKRMKDDSVVWCNRRMTKLMANPNCLMGWSELIYTHFFFKLPTGNAYMRAVVDESVKDKAKYRWCDHYWPLMPQRVKAVPPSYTVPIYGICDIDDLVDHYEVKLTNRGKIDVPTYQVWHDRDLIADLSHAGIRYLKSPSRLQSVMKPISNLCAVYEARNVIYVNRGALGFLVSQKKDETGTVAMTEKEKKEVRDVLTSDYGVGRGQMPFGVTDVPFAFIRTNLSIAELQPFEETLEDAVKIAGAFGIPDVLVPRRDHSTFSNQATAEKTVYSGVIIPMAKKFCEDFTIFLGLDKDGLYLDCNFSDVDCLQVGMKEAEEVKKLINDRCRDQFNQGMITLNDWRAQIHESQITEDELPLFSKLKYQMTDEELAFVQNITGNQINNTKTSTGDSNHERNEQESALSNESK